MSLARIKVAFEAFALERRTRHARQREEAALAQAGAKVFEAVRGERGRIESAPDARELCARLTAIEEQTATLNDALERSLAHDRADFARATEGMRWFVVGRGVFDRVLLRGDLRRETGKLPTLQRDLARLALDGAHEQLQSLLPAALANEVSSARDDATRARGEREKLLEPYNGEPLPRWLATASHEVRVFAGFVWEQLTKKVFLRGPAIAGLLVGWWLGRQFSDSAAANWVHQHVGLDIRDRSEVETKALLAFWLPLLAAALCSYVASFIALRVQRKYAPQTTGERATSA